MLRKLALALIAVGGIGILAGTGIAWFSLYAGQAEAEAEALEVNLGQSIEANLGQSIAVLHGGTRGRIAFPAQGKSYFVVEGATKKNLLKGPVHVANSVVPGAIGNSIIAAHRDTQFRLLKDLKEGEEVTVEEHGHTFHYSVTELHVVDPTDNRFYQPTSEAVLTLVTCYPFVYIGPAPRRYIVRAKLIDSGN